MLTSTLTSLQRQTEYKYPYCPLGVSVFAPILKCFMLGYPNISGAGLVWHLYGSLGDPPYKLSPDKKKSAQM